MYLHRRRIQGLSSLPVHWGPCGKMPRREPVHRPDSGSQRSLCPEPSLPVAGARWALLGVVNWGNLPWTGHSWAGGQSSAWHRQGRAGSSCGREPAPQPVPRSPPPCPWLHSRLQIAQGRQEVCALPQRHWAAAAGQPREESFTGPVRLPPWLLARALRSTPSLGTRAGPQRSGQTY